MRFEFNSKKGFTLIELLVVIAIIGIMSVVFIPSYKSLISNKVLFLGREQIVSDIRMVQDYSYNTRKFYSTTYPTGIFPAGGYGIHFISSSNSYIIFADLNSNHIYDSPGEKVEERVLSENIVVNSLTVDSTVNTVDIAFKPPYGEVYIDNDNTISKELKIEIKNINNITKIITIKGSRVVE